MNSLAICSELGGRESMEDAACATSLSGSPRERATRMLLAVADGVGGENGGEVASATALQHILSVLVPVLTFLSVGSAAPERVKSWMENLIHWTLGRTNELICSLADGSKELAGMATTIVLGAIVDDILVIGWAGDSRAYLFRNGKLWRLTEDHSIVAALLRESAIDAGQALGHPQAHQITNYLGRTTGFEAAISCCSLERDDLILMTSDGVTDVLSDDQLAEFMTAWQDAPSDPEELVRALVHEVLRYGACDNVTVALCRHHPHKNGSRRTRTHGYGRAIVDTFHPCNKEISHGTTNDRLVSRRTGIRTADD